MNDEPRYPIGALARLSGLTVKAVRFYSDAGLVPPTARSPGGYRLFGPEAVARLRLVRTLRELGLDLATIRRVVEREATLAAVAEAHTEALDTQIRTLRLRRATLAVWARRGYPPEEMEIVQKLSDDARHRLIAEFLDSVFGTDPALAGVRRSMTPELPEDPDDAQIAAWFELAALSADPGFRTGMRRLARQHAADRPAGPPRPDPVAIVRDLTRPAVEAGIDPASPEAEPTIAAVRTRVPTDAALLSRLESAADPRRDRYTDLLSTVNGWPATESLAPPLTWFIQALKARRTP